jgi:rhamnogalacturonyl hydrolase YesR
MAFTTAYAGKEIKGPGENWAARVQLYESIRSLYDWLEKNEYRGYDTFDGLNARLARRLTFESKFLRTVLQQGVRRFPLNVRPLLGIQKNHSSKAMGFFARGFIRLYEVTGEQIWQNNARWCLQWLLDNQSRGYSGACWGNHFDYQSRGFYLPKSVPTVVWTSLIGHAFLDGYECFRDERYLQTAVSACKHITKDLDRYSEEDGVCISYVPFMNCQVHNANTLAGSLLARTYSYTRQEEYLDLARKAMTYTANHQHLDGSWWYGEKRNLHWVDTFHTAYVLDCFKHYVQSCGDNRFEEVMLRGYAYWKRTFFLSSGAPRYYNHKALPFDIQSCSQSIDTLVLFFEHDRDGLQLALRTAQWTIANMQDRSGYFYYRRYNPWVVNKTPTLHWGQATMLCALSGLYLQLSRETR